MRIKANITSVFTERSYVSSPMIKFDEDKVIELITDKLSELQNKNQCPSFYLNHIVLVTDDGTLIGVNDGVVSIGRDMTTIGGNELKCDFKLSVMIKS